jgi:trehalose 6-phosphate synthase
MRLVVVSNRSPYLACRLNDNTRFVPALGGVAGALRQVLSKMGGTWVGWDGAFNNEKILPDLSFQPKKYAMRYVRLSPKEVRDYYLGFSNQVLWPICHTFTEKSRFEPNHWSAYQQVNLKFAQATLRELNQETVVWIHDYHLALVPNMLRMSTKKLPIGFFWHIPFPDLETFKELPNAHDIVAGLLASDLIGFHTEAYVNNFLHAAERLLNCKVDWIAARIEYRSRVVSVIVHPLGVDTGHFESLAADPATKDAAQKIRSWIGSHFLVISVDRVDYTKGLCERLAGIDRFFEWWPEFRGRMSLLQIAAPSRETIPEYHRLNAELKAASERINTRHGQGQWKPIYHVDFAVPLRDIVTCYRAADLALVTPLRDGMNLVSKEFVASQSGKHSALVLSRYAGAADMLGEDAVLIDPTNPENIAFGIRKALDLSDFERALRMKRLLRKVTRYNLHWWATTFLERLDGGYVYPLKLGLSEAVGIV